MTMVERVAQAIYEKRNGAGCYPWSLRTKAHKQPYFDDARAAIAALREPSEPMVKPGLTMPCASRSAANIGGRITSQTSTK